MAQDVEYILLHGRLYELGDELNFTEVAPPKADVVQSVVGPPDAAITPCESGRWPDRQMLTEARKFVLERLWAVQRYSSTEMSRSIAVAKLQEIVKYLEDLDKGGDESDRQDAGS